MFGNAKAKEAAKLAEALQVAVKQAVAEATQDFQGVKTLADLQKAKVGLMEQITKLEIERDKRNEDYARREREVEHKVGLERKRQEFELAAAKREALLSTREENLAAERKRFEEHVKFQAERFSTEVGYLKDLLTKIMERLPDVQVQAEAKVSPRAARRGA